MNELFEILSLQFMRNAVAACILASVLCGVVGAIVVVRRMVIVAGGVAHGAYGGLGIAIWLGISPQIGAFAFAVLLSLIMGAITLKDERRADTVIGVLWAFGMAVGIIFTDMTKGYTADMMSYLFGSLLIVSSSDLIMMGTMAAISIFLAAYFRRQLAAFLYDPDFAKLRGVNVKAIHYIMTLVVSLSTVVLIRIVGLILVIALLTIPAHLAERFSRSLAGMMIISAIFCASFSLLGLWLAFTYNLTAGACIVLAASFFYGLFLIFSGRRT